MRRDLSTNGVRVMKLVKWQFKVAGMFLFFPEGFDPNEDVELKRFGPWKLAGDAP